MSSRASFSLVLCAVLLRPAAVVAYSLPAHRAQDPAAPEVVAENVLASERFWPYQVALIRPWKPAGGEHLIEPGIPGVLIRVETGGLARLDFGRDGLHAVPIDQTDLLERANRVRLGEDEKRAPNFVLAIGPRLVDPQAEVDRPFDLAALSRRRFFLCVFTTLEDLAALRDALRPLGEHPGRLTLLFPQGPHPDAAVRERLRALEWKVPFVFDHLSEPYTSTLLPAGARLPLLMLLTAEGRVLLQRTWSEGAGPELIAALEEALAAPP